jgi:hypothetical protein
MFIRPTIRWKSRDEHFVDFLVCTHRLSLVHKAALRLRADLKERSAE